MANADSADLRARAIEQRQAELDCAVKVTGKHHEHAALRLQVSRLLHSQLLDYRHNSPTNIKKSVSLLLRLCQNVVDHPEEEKYRKVAKNCCKVFPHLFPAPPWTLVMQLPSPLSLPPHSLQVRAATTAFDRNISAYPAALQLLSLVGWRARVVDYEKHW